MPHTLGGKGYAVVSCHVERVLDDRVFSRYREFVATGPGGFRIASLVRPPDPDAGESQEAWAARVRELAALGPLGHHTHFGGPTQARPVDDGAAERVRSRVLSFAAASLEPRFFCGGGWYMDAAVAAAVAELGYVDCSATAYRQRYLAAGAPRVSVPAPAWLRLDGGGRLLELPATHSVGMLVRALPRPLRERVVHVHFHDWDVLSRPRAGAFATALRLLALRRRPLALDELAEQAAESAPELPFAEAAAG